MASLNKVQLIGNLGADPEVRYTAGGQPVANLRIATTEKFRGRDGQIVEHTEWHRIVVWGKQAESCKQYLSRGRQVYVEGSLEAREWTDKEGAKHTNTEIKALRILFLGGRETGQPGQAASAPASRPATSGSYTGTAGGAARPPQDPPPADEPPGAPIDDDIPF
jgi:single-strand DNA-binding protein